MHPATASRDLPLTGVPLKGKLTRMWELSGQKIMATEKSYDVSHGSPVFTVDGKWTSRGWTEWTQGFQYGSALLQFDATSDASFLEIGRRNTVERMAPHVSHVGVHDHGFNNISTYGGLWRLMNEGRIPEHAWERAFYELALRLSGAIAPMVPSRPISRNSESPVASNWRMAEPNWKPCVHSVQPRLVYLPPTVKTGAPLAGAQDFSMERILAADTANIRRTLGSSALSSAADCVSTIPRNFSPNAPGRLWVRANEEVRALLGGGLASRARLGA